MAVSAMGAPTCPHTRKTHRNRRVSTRFRRHSQQFVDGSGARSRYGRTGGAVSEYIC